MAVFTPHPPNGDLESGLEHWEQDNPFSVVDLDTTFRHGGANSLRVTTIATGQVGARIEPTGTVKPPSFLVPANPGPLSGWYYTDDPAIDTARLLLAYFDSELGYLGAFWADAPAATGEWTSASITPSPPAGTVYFGLAAVGLGAGEDGVVPAGTVMWWDDFAWASLVSAAGWYVGHPIGGSPVPPG